MLRRIMALMQTDAGLTVRSKIAWRLLPFLFLLYIANYIDRTNIAYATLGMKGELGLTDSVFGTASGIFFIGYFALQIPGALLVERWSARWLLRARSSKAFATGSSTGSSSPTSSRRSILRPGSDAT